MISEETLERVFTDVEHACPLLTHQEIQRSPSRWRP
jgi:hypothetical protein